MLVLCVGKLCPYTLSSREKDVFVFVFVFGKYIKCLYITFIQIIKNHLITPKMSVFTKKGPFSRAKKPDFEV